MAPHQVRSAVRGFSPKYVEDWRTWLGTADSSRAETFGRILRRLQATRPREMRRDRAANRHAPPFLEDLIDRAAGPLHAIRHLTVMNIRRRSGSQDAALHALWDLFQGLTVSEAASAVAISKSVLLLTCGKIGPALYSRVQKGIGIGRPGDAQEWVSIIEAVGDDIVAFEDRCGRLSDAVPPEFRDLEYGRLYDMALGPR